MIDHPPPPETIFGDTEPTTERLATARRLLDQHRDIRIPFNNFCAWCLKPWPCPDVRWSDLVVQRSGQADG